MIAVSARLNKGVRSGISSEAITPPKFAPLQKLVRITDEYTNAFMMRSKAPSELALCDIDLTRR